MKSIFFFACSLLSCTDILPLSISPYFLFLCSQVKLVFLNLHHFFFSSQSKSFSVTNMDDAAAVVKMSLAQFQLQVRFLVLT